MFKSAKANILNRDFYSSFTQKKTQFCKTSFLWKCVLFKNIKHTLISNIKQHIAIYALNWLCKLRPFTYVTHMQILVITSGLLRMIHCLQIESYIKFQCQTCQTECLNQNYSSIASNLKFCSSGCRCFLQDELSKFGFNRLNFAWCLLCAIKTTDGLQYQEQHLFHTCKQSKADMQTFVFNKTLTVSFRRIQNTK